MSDLVSLHLYELHGNTCQPSASIALVDSGHFPVAWNAQWNQVGHGLTSQTGVRDVVAVQHLGCLAACVASLPVMGEDLLTLLLPAVRLHVCFVCLGYHILYYSRRGRLNTGPFVVMLCSPRLIFVGRTGEGWCLTSLARGLGGASAHVVSLLLSVRDLTNDLL